MDFIIGLIISSLVLIYHEEYMPPGRHHEEKNFPYYFLSCRA
jgi:hypothetical protein